MAQVIKTLKKTGGDYATVGDAMAWYNAFDCVATQNHPVLVIADNYTSSEWAFVRFRTATGSELYYGTIRAAAGMSLQEVDPAAALGFAPTGTITLAFISWGGVELDRFTRILGLNLLATQSTSQNYPCVQFNQTALQGCRLHSNDVSTGFRLGTNTDLDDCIIYGSGAGTVMDQWYSTRPLRRNTWIANAGFTGVLFQGRDGANGPHLDSIFDTDGANQIVYQYGAPGSTANNLVKHTFAGIIAGFTVNAGPLITSKLDARPPAGSPAIGAGSAAFRNLLDHGGRNRGMANDIGAVQRTPGIALATGTIAAPVIVATEGRLTQTGTQQNAVSGTFTLSRADRPDIGPIAITINGANWSIPDRTGLFYGQWTRTLRLLNADGGETVVQDSFYMTPTQALPEGTVVTPQTSGQVILMSGTHLRAVSGTVRMTGPDTAEVPIVISNGNWSAEIVGTPGTTYGGSKLSLLNPGGPNEPTNGIGPGVVLDGMSGEIQEPEAEPAADTSPLIPSGNTDYRRGLLLRLAA